MGYEQKGSLVELFSPDLAREAVRHMAEDGGDFLFAEIVKNTPVSYTNLAFQLAGYSVSRPPGTLKASWRRLPAEPAEDWVHGGWTVKVETHDPIAPYVEWDTRPHTILPKTPGGRLRFRTWPLGELVYAKIVHHPGTKGQHMVGFAAHKARLQFEEICRPALDRWAHEQMARARAA